MDDTYRLKIKLAGHEFEAEGPVQVVQAQFAAFKEMVAQLGAAPAVPAMAHIVTPAQADAARAESAQRDELQDNRLDKIMQLSNRVVSLTARPSSTEDAILLLLYGQKMLRQNDGVTGAEVVQGVQATGGLAVTRSDRILDKLANNGDVIVIGERRSRRYRLTNAGLQKARQVAGDLLRIVA